MPKSFRKQIILTYVAGFFVLVSLFVFYMVRQEVAALYRVSNERTLALAGTLANICGSRVSASDLQGLEEVIHSIRNDPGLEYAMVISLSGRVLAHTDPGMIGKIVADPAGRMLQFDSPGAYVMRDDADFIDVAFPVIVKGTHLGWARVGRKRQIVSANLDRIVRDGVWFVLASTLLSVLAAHLLAGRIGSRVGSLVKIAKGVESGDFDRRSGSTGEGDEISVLAASIDSMLDALAENRRGLAEAFQYARRLIEASLDPLVTISSEGKITDVNQATVNATGVSRKELLGTEFSDYFTEPEKAREGYLEVFGKGFVKDYPLTLRHRDGRLFHVIYNASLYRDEDGKVLGVFAAARDITERRLAELELARANLRNRLILDSAGEGIYGLDIQGRCTFANPVALRILGYSWEQISGMNSHQLFHHSFPDGKPYPREQCPVHAAYREGMVRRGRDHYWRSDGGAFPVEFVSTPILEEGVVSGAVVVFRDITERRIAEEKLKRSEQGLADAQRIAHLGNWELDVATGRLSWSDEIFRIFEIDPEKFGASYEAFLDAIHPEDRERVNLAYTESLKNHAGYDIVHRLRMKDGRIKYVNEKCETHYGENGEPLRSVGTVHDITAQKYAEEELREQEMHSRSLLRLSRALERAEGYQHVIEAARDEVQAVIGYRNLWAYLLSEDRKFAKALVAGGPSSDIVMSEQGAATLVIEGDPMLEEIANATEIVLIEDAQTGSGVNREIVGRLGNRTIVNIPVILSGRHLGSVGTGTFGEEGVKVPTPSEQKYLISLASQLAGAIDRIHLAQERRRFENELRELNHDFVTLLENTGDFIYYKDRESRFRFCSQTLANITGHASWRDMIGKNDFEVFPEETARIYHEEEKPVFAQGIALLNRIDPYYDEAGQRRWVSTNKWPVFAEDGKTVVGIFGISRDVTEIRASEERINALNRDLEARVAERTAQLEAANRELESFSYSVSHDLRVPLRAIDGFSGIVVEEYGDRLDEEGKRLLGVVRENTRKMAQLIEDILAFSRTGRLELSPVDVDMEKLVREVIAELVPSAEIDFSVGKLLPAHVDRAMMVRVWINLISNAVKFSRNREKAKIEVGSLAGKGENIYFVRDNGVGFDMNYYGKLFGVFQRLHAVSEFEGTGIGLAIVKRIVTRHGGRVWGEGKTDEGATFYFSLPTEENRG